MPLLPLLALLLVPRSAPRKVAVVVGVSGYFVPKEKGAGGFESLRFAHLDAERMAKRLTGLGWEVTLLQGFPNATASDATKAGILGALRGLKTENGDTVLFYFSGHGVRVDGKDHLVPADGLFRDESTDPEVPKWKADRSTLLSYDELAEAFAVMRADKRLMVVDACRDEPKASKGGDGPDSRVNQAKLGEVVQTSRFGATSYAVMYSCRPGQRSYEDPRLQGGVFTNAWLGALDSGRVTNAAGDVSLGELNTELRRRVTAWAAANSGTEMSPNMTTAVEDPIVIGHLNAASGGRAVLLPTRARLVVITDVAGASMTVDGLASGLVYEGEVPAGGTREATVVVSAPERESATYKVTLEAGKETPLRAELSPASSAPVARKRDYAQLLPWKSATLGNWVLSTDLSPDGRTVAAATLGPAFVAPAVAPDKGRRIEGKISSVAFSADGTTLYAGTSMGSLGLYDAATGKLRSEVGGHDRSIYGITLSPDGRTLATSSEDHTAVLREPATGKVRRVLAGHEQRILGVAFSPDSRTVATASSDGTAILWDVQSGKAMRTLKGDKSLLSVAFSPSGLLATSEIKGKVLLWNPATGERVRTFGEGGEALSLAISPDGATLAVGDKNGTVTLYDAASGEAVRTLSAHTDAVTVVRFSLDGSLLLTGSSDKTIRLYRLPG